jgi:hypothetical protein
MEAQGLWLEKDLGSRHNQAPLALCSQIRFVMYRMAMS